jgi:hypothetical protein
LSVVVHCHRPERWRLLRATWLTMGSQLNQVQQDFAHLHHLLRNIGRKNSNSSSNTPRPGSPTASGTQSSAAAAAAAAAAGGCGVGQQKPHGVCFDGFASMEDSNAYDYAAAAVQVRRLFSHVDLCYAVAAWSVYSAAASMCALLVTRMVHWNQCSKAPSLQLVSTAL